VNHSADGSHGEPRQTSQSQVSHAELRYNGLTTWVTAISSEYQQSRGSRRRSAAL